MNLFSATVQLLFLGLLVTGCKSLDKFDTKNGEAFCGSMVAANYNSKGFEYWTSKTPELKMALTLDTDKLAGIPGRLRSNDAEFGPCAPHALFEDADIRVIQEALGDRIAGISLGDDHVDEILAFVDSTCSGSMLAIVSLVQNGSAELRLLRPAKDVETPVGDQPRFGVFGLNKVNTKRDCDF